QKGAARRRPQYDRGIHSTRLRDTESLKGSRWLGVRWSCPRRKEFERFLAHRAVWLRRQSAPGRPSGRSEVPMPASIPLERPRPTERWKPTPGADVFFETKKYLASAPTNIFGSGSRKRPRPTGSPRSNEIPRWTE